MGNPPPVRDRSTEKANAWQRKNAGTSDNNNGQELPYRVDAFLQMTDTFSRWRQVLRIGFTRASFVKPCIFDFFKFTGLWWKIDDSSHFPALLASILYEWVRFQIRVAEIYFASML